MKAFRKLKNLFSFAAAPASYPEAISLADCIGCRDAELPRIKPLMMPRSFAEEMRAWVRDNETGELVDATCNDTPSQFVDAPLTLKVAALSEADSGNQYSEQEHFVGEHLMQIGAQVLDDDGAVYAANLATFIKLLQDYQAPLFFTAGVESEAINKWRKGHAELAHKLSKAQDRISELDGDVAALRDDLDTVEHHLVDANLRADNAGRNASAFEERMGQLQVECGRLEDRRHNDNDASDLLIKGLRDRVAHLGGVNKRLRSKVRVARNQRNQARAKNELLQVQAVNDAEANTAIRAERSHWCGQLVEVVRRYKNGTLTHADSNEALDGRLYIAK